MADVCIIAARFRHVRGSRRSVARERAFEHRFDARPIFGADVHGSEESILRPNLTIEVG
jgi:hypothetical protein